MNRIININNSAIFFIEIVVPFCRGSTSQRPFPNGVMEGLLFDKGATI